MAEYLRAWNTQEMIAEKFDTTQKNISEIIDNIRNGDIAKRYKDFQPYIYNIWSCKLNEKWARC